MSFTRIGLFIWFIIEFIFGIVFGMYGCREGFYGRERGEMGVGSILSKILCGGMEDFI